LCAVAIVSGTYITALFTSQIAIYDGAMGTMIQNYAKRNKPDEQEYRGEASRTGTLL
jgi:methionine synthase I (cobalamin-dependent)